MPVGYWKGKVFSDEHRRNLSLAHKGLDNHQKGRCHSEEARRRIGLLSLGNTYRRGKEVSEEVRQKISISVSRSLLGNQHSANKPWSEARRKAQEARKGKPYKSKKRSKIISKNGKEYPSNWHEIRKQIYRRDKWTCQECGIHCGTKNKSKIQCHHIDYDTANNVCSNLLTLCASCHAKTNFRRKDWKKYYKNKERN